MANYRQVSYGSQGSDVAELQKLLNSKGNYNLATDGIFGEKTQAAVKDYQSKNGLDVDGIAGNYTWGSLTGGSQQSGSTATSSNSGFQISDKTAAADQNRQAVAANKPGEFSYDNYEDSDIVKQAKAAIDQQLANKPGDMQFSMGNQWNDIINKILNREKFSYDLNGDALYQQYKDQYTTQGQQAMMDTMGQAAAMTGGYGNSYAQKAGQQTYQGYMQQLNDKIPELYQLALDQYNREGDDLYNQYGLLSNEYDREYTQHRDSVSDHNNELARLWNEYTYLSDQGYGRWLDKTNLDREINRDSVSDYYTDLGIANDEYWNQYSSDINNRDFAYQKEQDALAEEWRKKEYDLALDKWNTEKNKINSSSTPENTTNNSTLVGNPGGNTEEKEQKPASSEAKRFVGTLHSEREHDAIARATYGPYSAYVAYMLAQAGLSEEDEAWVVNEYGITSSDREYLESKGLI